MQLLFKCLPALVKCFPALLVLGCDALLLAEDGSVCAADSECEGVCWRGVCHGIEPRACDPSVVQGEPCMRPRGPTEDECRSVREGRWLCTADAVTECRVSNRNWRDWHDAEGAQCDEDHDGETDEPHGECENTPDRTWFDGYEGIARIALDYADARFGADGLIDIDPLHEDGWREPTWVLGDRAWTWASSCPLPPADAPQTYGGRWVQWPIPALPQATQVSIEVHQVLFAPRLPEFVARRFLGRLSILIVPEEAAPFYLETGRIEPIRNHTIAARWSCVLLPAGRSTLYVFDHDPDEGCACGAEVCPPALLFAPTDLLFDNAVERRESIQ